MKKLLHKTGLISIALLYCFAIGLYSGVAYAGDAAFLKEDGNSSESYTASVSAKSFQHIVETENAVTVCSHNHIVTLKNTHKDFLAANQAAEQLLLHTFSQYNFFLTQNLPGYKIPTSFSPFIISGNSLSPSCL